MSFIIRGVEYQDRYVPIGLDQCPSCRAGLQFEMPHGMYGLYHKQCQSEHYSPYDTPEIEGRALDVLDAFIDRMAPEGSE